MVHDAQIAERALPSYRCAGGAKPLRIVGGRARSLITKMGTRQYVGLPLLRAVLGLK